MIKKKIQTILMFYVLNTMKFVQFYNTPYQSEYWHCAYLTASIVIIIMCLFVNPREMSAQSYIRNFEISVLTRNCI